MKAFFSHSHHDQEIVHAVAQQVGRIFVTIDIAAFHTSDELIRSVETAVRESAIFVYFVSRAALRSAWVSFEVNEARYHQAFSRVKKIIVVLLDDGLQITDFPEWMRRFIFVKSHAARPIARVIRDAIDTMVSEDQSSYFVGRAAETTELQAALVPPDTSGDVTLVTIRGLPGIGRRSLLRRVARDSLFIDRLLTVRVEPGDDTNSVAAKLADLIEAVTTPDETLAMVRQIQLASQEEAAVRFAGDAGRAMELHELVVLYDDGGILDNEGFLTNAVTPLLLESAKKPGQLVALVTNRRPRRADISGLQELPVVDVAPLRQSEVRQLIALRSRADGINLTPVHLSALTEQAKGCPPAVTALIALVKVYGPDLIVGPSAPDAAYQPRPLTRYLSDISLSAGERRMIAVLARNSPLPLTILQLFAPSAQEAARGLANLIDASLVIPQLGTAWYRISDPVADYIDREFPPCSLDDYLVIADALDHFLVEAHDDGAYLELSRVLYRALIHAGREARPRAYALAADWLRLAAEFYHQRDYQRSLELANIAYANVRGHEALSWIIRSKVKLGDFSEALHDIDSLRNMGHSRDASFYRGFLERNRGEYRAAMRHYEMARAAGRGGLALERDLAECYFQIGDLERASQHIEAAQARQSDNPYVLSLRIKIACRRFDEDTARGLLPLLDKVDSRTFAAHRRSLVELTFGTAEAALRFAHEAVAASDRPPAEALANLAYCQILAGTPADAVSTLSVLESLYGTRWRSDVLNSLRARAALADQRFEDAVAFSDLLARDTIANLRLKRSAVEGLLEHVYVPSEERRRHEQALADLDARLATVDDVSGDTERYWDVFED